MNWKSILGSLSIVAGGVALAIAHNIDSIIANPGSAIGIVLAAIGAAFLSHNAGDKSGQAKGETNIVDQLSPTQAANVVRKT